MGAIPKGPAGIPLATPWLEPARRSRLQNLNIPLIDSSGRAHSLDGLVDRPILLTFFYTRCQNAGKCPATIAQLAALQRDLTSQGIESKVRLVAITFEPQFDTPDRLERFVRDRGLTPDSHTLAVQLDVGRQSKLTDELRVPVAYNAGWVSSHGVEAALLDRQGRVVRKYVTLHWDNAVVVDDFVRLLKEQ